MTGVILEVHDSNTIEIEVVKNDGTNIEYKGAFTFTISINQIEIIGN